jgi:molecular chaperone GrpE
MGIDMTEQTARTEDAAGMPQEAGSPASAAAPEADAAALAADLKDKLLRTLAEMENLRKRTAREVTDARLYGVTSFARDMLAVADNMRRALDAVSPALRASAEAGVKSLIDGVELTERELLKALEKSGVRQFTPKGEKFDPNVHQAMYEVPDVSVPAGSIVEVVQPGYMIGERVLRPAMVGVSKGGPRTAPKPRSANDNAGTGSENF